MVYQHTPEVVRKRADQVVAMVKPSLCAAAKTEEAKKLRDTGSEACTAFVGCVTAIWAFFEPALAALIFDVASFGRDRRANASGIESHLIALLDHIYNIAAKCAMKCGAFLSSYGGVPEQAVEYATKGVAWVSRKSVVLENAETDENGKVVYKNAKEVVTAPRASINAALSSTEGQRFRKASYAVVLAIVACGAALMGALVPVLAGGVAWAVAAYWERRRAATGLDSYVFSLVHSFWCITDKATSTGVRVAESYQGPGSLTLLQLTTALKMFVEWLKSAGRKGLNDEVVASASGSASSSSSSSSLDKKVIGKAEEIVERAEKVVDKIEAVVDKAESETTEESSKLVVTEVDAVLVPEIGAAAVASTEVVVEKAEAESMQGLE